MGSSDSTVKHSWRNCWDLLSLKKKAVTDPREERGGQRLVVSILTSGNPTLSVNRIRTWAQIAVVFTSLKSPPKLTGRAKR